MKLQDQQKKLRGQKLAFYYRNREKLNKYAREHYKKNYMELKNQVCSLEISKRLKELGVKQKSFFRWQEWKDPDSGRKKKVIIQEGGYTYGDVYSAFTVAELGEVFSKEGEIEMPRYNARLKKWERELAKGGWISCDTEADARGRLLIYLLENNLIPQP